MFTGPNTTSTNSDATAQHQKKLPTFWSNFIGSGIATLLEVGGLHPVDTFVKNRLKPQSEWAKFINEFGALRIKGKVSRAYKGVGAALIKKGPQRGQKWLMQDEVRKRLEEKFGSFFTATAGNKDKIFIAGVSGAITGIAEPLFVQPFDTLQIMAQNNKGIKANLETAKALGMKKLYRSTLLTGFLRNAPGSIALFAGSEAANQSLDNADKKSHLKNLGAKFAGATASSIVSQPADVLKVSMQSNQLSAREALKDLDLHDLCTRGFVARLIFSSAKVATAFFVAEKCMEKAAEWFGEHPENKTKCRPG